MRIELAVREPLPSGIRRGDRASRRENAEGIIEFCRDTLLNRANERVRPEELGRYPAGKVAETPPGEDPE